MSQHPLIYKANGRALPRLFLLSDKRNDHMLEQSIRKLPMGSGFVFRHYHLPEDERRIRFMHLRNLIHSRNGLAILSGDARTARLWGADGFYGAPIYHKQSGTSGLLHIATVHEVTEARQARTIKADMAFLSPIYATQSHANAQPLGLLKAALIAKTCPMAIYALGGMNHRNARHIQHFAHGWAAIDGLSS